MEDIDAVEIFHSGRWNNINDWRSDKPFSVRHGWIDCSDKPQEPAGLPIRQLKDERWYLENIQAADELKLIHRAQAGDKAASETLFRHHYKQILKIVRRFKRGLRADDATAIACQGFFYALQNYKPLPGGSNRRGARLSTYAAHCVEGRLKDAVKPKALFGLFGTVPKGEWIEFHELGKALENDGPAGGRQRDVESTIPADSRSAWHGNRFTEERDRQRGIEVAILWGSFGKAGDSLERIAVAQDEAQARRIKEVGRRAAALELVERRRVIGKAEYLQHEPQWKAALNEQYQKSKRREAERNDKPAAPARNGAPYRAGRIRAWHAQGAIHQVSM